MTAATSIGVIGQFNLLEQLPPSGPGDLFRARDTKHGRTVVVRLLPPGFTVPGLTREGIIDVARALATLSHPNVITIFDVGDHGGRTYLAFEFLKGQPLRAEIAGRQLNVRRAVELAIQIADAVAEAHATGYVHGGLSPESVVITAKGHAKIPAFVLASAGGFEQGPNGVRLRDYDSPEEAGGQRADDRSDVYSVGAILYEMLTTRRPSHRGASAPSSSNPHVPRALDDIVLKAVAPNPDARFPRAALFASELRGVAAMLDVHGAGDDDPVEVPSARIGTAVALAAVILAVAALLTWWLSGSG